MHLAYILLPPGFWLRCQNPRRHPLSPHVNKYAFCFCLFVLLVWYTYGSIEVWILDRLEHSEEHKWYQMVFSMVISIWYWSLLSKPFLGSDSRTIPTEVSIWWPKPRIEMPVWNLVLRFCFRNFAVAMVLMQSLRGIHRDHHVFSDDKIVHGPRPQNFEFPTTRGDKGYHIFLETLAPLLYFYLW